MTCTITSLSANIADLLLDVIFLVDSSGSIVDVSAGCVQMLGFRPEEMIGRRLFDFVAEEDRSRTQAEAARVESGLDRVGFENRYRRKDGGLVDIMWSARRIDERGLRLGVARDITARKQAERRQAALYAVSEAAHQAPDLGQLCARIHAVLDGLVGVAGMAVVTDDAQGAAHVIYLETSESCRLAAPGLARWRSAPPPGWLVLELGGAASAAGALMLSSASGAPYPAPDRELLQFSAGQVGMALERQRLHDDLLRHACHDELTGLPNRYLFFDRIGNALARSRRTDARVGLLYVDVDDFKQVNDQLGHAAGDVLLREVGGRLADCARGSDTVARLGGDEFVLILEDLGTPEDAGRIARQICAVMEVPVRIDGIELRIRASIGSAVFPDDGQRIEDLLKHADQAMYVDKRERKARAGAGEAATPPAGIRLALAG